MKTFQIPAGQYCICDPALVIPASAWLSCLVDLHGNTTAQIEFGEGTLWLGKLNSKSPIKDQLENPYPIVSGFIGIVPIEMIDNVSEEYEDGTIVESKSPIIVKYDGEFISFTSDGPEPYIIFDMNPKYVAPPGSGNPDLDEI